jgi:manganese/iron transport system substrate-binding protein
MLRNSVQSPYSYWPLGIIATTVSVLSACTQPASQTDFTPPVEATLPLAERTLKVVATSSVLCDLAKQVAEGTVNLTCLVKAGVDPHTYEPTPEDRKAIEQAQLIFYSGYDFEPSLIKLIKATSSPAPKVAIAELAVPQPLLGKEHHEKDEAQKQNETNSHEAEEPDPHVWHNAQNGVRMVEVIQRSLAKASPDKAALYQKNAINLTATLTQLDGWIKTQIATIPPSSRKLITTHDALGYYSDAYKISVEGALQGLSTEEKPTAARVKVLVDDIKAAQVPTIFAELTDNPKLLETVAKDAQVKISSRTLFADGLGELGSEGDTYQKMLIANTQAIVEGLGGTYTSFKSE